jgi:citrate lyase beta subunit
MQHFEHLSDEDRARLFFRAPEHFSRSADVATLSVALGATLYMPATRPTIARDLVRQRAKGAMSSVICVEDAISDDDVQAGEANAVAQLTEFAAANADDAAPLVFIRVRHPEQIAAIAGRLGDAVRILSGFVLPKFTDSSGAAYLDALEDTSRSIGHRLLGMPVIESPEVIYRESRAEALVGIQRLLAKHRPSVLAVRTGATDLCAAYGIRRDRDLTIWDVPVVADVIADVVNILGRADGTGHVVTGPVWEYFSNHERIFKPLLRQSPFDERDGRLRQDLLTRDIDGLIREVVLDKANGLTGKTVIHPSHVAAVHALSVVTMEEFTDASDVLGADMLGGGVRASGYRNKMNESKPHRAWAERVLRRAAAFGVVAEDVTYVDVLAAGVDA